MPKLKTPLSRWFEIPDDPCNGRVKVAHLTKTEVQDIMAKGIDSKVVYRNQDQPGKPLPETETKINNSVIRTELALAAVDAWENFLDQDDKPLDCTPENVRLFARDDEFMANLGKFRESLAKEAAALEEAARKNSKALPSGCPA